MTNSPSKPQVVVSGAFDNVKTPDIRFIQEAARLGNLHVLLYSDELVQTLSGAAPRFPESERQYFLQSVRYVSQVSLVHALPDPNSLPALVQPENALWVVPEAQDNTQKQQYCLEHHLQYQVIRQETLSGYPIEHNAALGGSSRKKVLVTGSFDWLHSGHVRFFEEASELGDLFVVVGHDDNIKLLKGEGHPLFSQDERHFMVHAIRFVHMSMISTGHGWMDAEPEVELIKPDLYVVNEDGDKPEKAQYCQEHGIEYKVLKRMPKPGLPRRASTNLRGF
jgi:cytidyltransferase-like protein